MLIGNYSVLNKTPGRWVSGGSTAGTNQAQSRANWGKTGSIRGFSLQHGNATALKLHGVPTGYYTGWMLPITAGSLSSNYNAIGASVLAGAMAAGINITGSLAGSELAVAIGQLIVSAGGAATGSTTLSGNVVASLAATGYANGSGTATANIGALVWGSGSAAGVGDATLVSYATGRLSGSITPFTELSPQSLAAAVWNELIANHQEPGSMGAALYGAGGGTTPESIWGYLIDGGYSAEDIVRLLAAAMAGKVYGAETATVRFRNLADTTDAITATVDGAGNRTAISYDVQ